MSCPGRRRHVTEPAGTTPHQAATLFSLHLVLSASSPPSSPSSLEVGNESVDIGRKSVRRLCCCMIGLSWPLSCHWSGCLELHVFRKKMSAAQGIFDGSKSNRMALPLWNAVEETYRAISRPCYSPIESLKVWPKTKPDDANGP
ncbi:hypothetical protein J3F83DRAFT_732599 [Trichoderma novae-zelandiae]